ncbi:MULTISPECIES: hypothetical protein [Bifidobacterium]|jgi:hypothetical protein|uniref:hypothetical protein n=1 Tax=Bifidobacterium TaxID=1678 RepID=UPI00129C2929|nr:MULTISPECIES: hypothetical protein [Bifidobacterium]MCB4867887.1 hypothetical protein [Bifidobacterium pseudocatenulatum]
MIRTIFGNFRSTAPRLPPSVWDAHGRTLAALAPNNFDCSFCVLECDAFHSFAAFISWTSPSKKSMMRLQMATADVLSWVFPLRFRL